MSISSELTALQQDITNARTKITEKGGTITPSGGSSQLATDIATIPTGGQARVKDISPITQNGTYKVFNDLVLVDKLICTGQGWFETDIVPTDNNYDVEFKCKFTNRQGSLVYGVYGDVSGYFYTFKGDGTRKGRLDSYAYNKYITQMSVFSLDTDYTVSVQNNYIYVNDVRYTMNRQQDFSNTSRTLSLLTANCGELFVQRFYGEIEYIKFSRGGEVVYWFVPARNSDNEPLFYEKINQKIYEASGTGITVGNDISDESYDGFASPLVVNVDKSKYGATMDGIFGDVDSNGAINYPSEVTNFVFTGVRSVPDNMFRYRFYYHPNITSVSFPDLETTGNYSFQYAFYGSSANGNITTLNINNLVTVNSYSLQYAFYYQKLTNQVINLQNLTFVGSYAFQYAFFKSNILGFYTNSLTSLTYTNAFSYTFQQTQNDNLDIKFNNLATINGSSIFSYAFQGSYVGKDKVLHIFPDLVGINQSSNFQYAFQYLRCIRLVFDKLEYIGDPSSGSATSTTFINAFQYADMPFETGHDNDNDRIGLFCTALKTLGQNSTSANRNFSGAFTNATKHTIHFYDLTTIYNSSSTASYGQFNQCNAKRIYMPKVTNMGTYNKNCFYNSTSTEEIHFGKENEATIQAMNGYSTKFGATNATLYFDMANHIVVNGTTYDRDGAGCDLDDWYFSWKDSNDNIIYTTDFKDPVGLDTYTRSGTAGSYVYTATGDTVASST